MDRQTQIWEENRQEREEKALSMADSEENRSESSDGNEYANKLQEFEWTMNAKKMSAKENAHVVAMREALAINYQSFMATYNEHMEIEREINAPNEEPGSWAAVLEEKYRMPDSLDNDVSKTNSPSMLHLFREVFDIVEKKYLEMEAARWHYNPHYDFARGRGIWGPHLGTQRHLDRPISRLESLGIVTMRELADRSSAIPSAPSLTIPNTPTPALSLTNLASSSSNPPPLIPIPPSILHQTIHHRDAPTLLTELTPAIFKAFVMKVATLRSQGQVCPIDSWIPERSEARYSLGYHMLAHKVVKDETEFLNSLNDVATFLTLSNVLISKMSLMKDGVSHVALVRQTLLFDIDLRQASNAINKVVDLISKFRSNHKEIVELPNIDEQKLFTEAMIDINLKRQGVSQGQRVIFQDMKDEKTPKIVNLSQSFTRLIVLCTDAKSICDKAHTYGMRFPDQTDQSTKPGAKSSNPHLPGGGTGGGGKRALESDQHLKSATGKTCSFCGYDNHLVKDCNQKRDGKKNPYFNHIRVDYEKSPAWKQCLKKFPRILEIVGYPRAPSQAHLEAYAKLDGETDGKPSKKPFKGNPPCVHLNTISQHCEKCDACKHVVHLLTNNDDVCALISNDHSPYLNFAEINIPNKRKKTQEKLDVEGLPVIQKVPSWALVDTGALHGSYVGTWIIKHNLTVVEENLKRQICSPINNSCISLTDSVLANVSLYDKDKNNKFDFEIKLKILSSLDDKEYGLIIGLPDIKRHNLLNKLANQFTDAKIDSNVRELQSVSVRKNLKRYSESDKFANQPIDLKSGSVGGGLKSSTSPSAHTRITINQAQTAPMINGVDDMLSTMHSQHKPVHRNHVYDEDDEVIQYNYWDDAWQKNDVENSSIKEDLIGPIVSKINSSDPTFAKEIYTFLTKYEDLFSRNLNAIPADLDPLEIEVDSKKFMTKQSQGPPRMMTTEKESHIEKFIAEGLKSNIIRPSKATHYSQVHLVAKPTDDPTVKKWRTTIDYRFFNQCITPQHWPLPNISQMLQRIGRAKPKYFAKLDMTSGYWQAPLAENTKRFTAFITFMGIFEWNRAPMGTQPAGGYFHYCIAFVVLVNLVYKILEAYIDDILIHAKTKDEFMTNLDLVFSRFRKHRITFNPDKVFFSDSTMEFVGHEIAHDGIQFSKKKLSGVNDIPVPATKGELKKFIGAANYFRDHVRNHSDLTHPLNELLPKYDRKQRNHKITWTDELKEAFYALRDAVANCPKLHFINDFWEIGLETDASDYGIGAFLFQINPETGQKIPVHFVSKSLTGPQLRWSTPEKEMYAKYFAVKKLEYMLGDVPFTWYTDHKNNTLVRNNGSDKVLRWDLYLQQFDITKKYIKGEDNEITDSWSRLCAVSDKTEYLTLLEEMECPSSEYLNLMTEKVMTIEEIAILAQPRELNPEVYRKLAKVHNSSVGHLGVERTMAKLKRHGDQWEGMKADIISFIKKCPCCQKMSKLKVPIHTTPFTTASYGLMKKLSMDCIGPLKETEDGYTHILVIIDNFSRYACLYALKGVTALEVAANVLTHIGMFGCPQILQMDNGTEFINETVSEVVKLIDTTSAAILAYSKEENAIVERCNKEVMRHLQAMVFEINKRNAWKIYLPLAQRIINSEIHSRIGVSPNELVFGGKIDLDGGFLTTPIVQSQNVNISNWSSDMINLQNKLVDIAQKRQIEQDEIFIQKRQQNALVTQFRPNSFVLVQYPNSAMGTRAPTKLHTHWKGPMRVISNKGAEYTLLDLVQNKNVTVHVTRLKEFEHDPARHNPLEIAAKDYEEDEVEKIIRHTGDPKRKSSMDFLVRWLGYDDSEDLWLPWSALRNNVALHTYLRDNNMEKLIPKNV